MKLKNIFIKRSYLNLRYLPRLLINYAKVYFLVLGLLLLVVIRVISYTFPPAVEKNFTSTAVINQPPFVDGGVVNIVTPKYTIKTHTLDYYSNNNVPLQPGDKLQMTGDRYHKNIYPNTIRYIGASWLKPLYRIKSLYLNASATLLSEPYTSLLNGMVFGTTPVITNDFKDQLITTGVIHVIVVSGFNIAIMFSVATTLLRGLNIKLTIFVGSILVIIYCLVVGLEPPVVRALVMGLLVGFSKAFGYVRSTIYILIISCLMLLLIDPSYLVSVSFQLTFAASLGLVLLSNPLLMLLEELFWWFKMLPLLIKESFVSSFVAQIFVMPIISFYFGRISVVGFVVNPLVSWLIPIIMAVGFVFTTLYILGFGLLSQAFVGLLLAPLVLFVDIVQLASNIPGGNIPISIQPLILIAYYIVLAVFSIFVINSCNKMINIE